MFTQHHEELLDGRTIKTLRILRGWSQRRLAAESHMHIQRIWKIENQVDAPRLGELAAIIRALSTGPQIDGGRER